MKKDYLRKQSVTAWFQTGSCLQENHSLACVGLDPSLKKAFTLISFSLMVLVGCNDGSTGNANSIQKNIHLDPNTGIYHVYPGENIQDTLEIAAKDPLNKTIKVHAGTYRPESHGEALIWFNQVHDGIVLVAVGEVTLTAANPQIANPNASSYPAVVNHVVYFGDRISRKTVFRGFKITGANNYTLGPHHFSRIEPNIFLRKGLFFNTDGGGIKIFGRSYPTIENVEVFNNYTGICGAGASVEHRGRSKDQSVLFKNCVFRNNRTGITGSAIDLLYGSSATIENCLFIGNVSNTGLDYNRSISENLKYNEKHGSGALTVFPRSRATVIRSTFTDNWAGVDDKGSGSTYVNNIFWNNNRLGGISPGDRYELDLSSGEGVKGNFIHGDVNDLRGIISPIENTFDPPNPQFDSSFIPHSEEYSGVGYRTTY